MSKGQLQIHTENILPIIKRWLYSDKEIFIRELVSNACDAIKKLEILKNRGSASDIDSSAHKIQISIDAEGKTLTFSDTGIGMTKEEVEKYIAQVAFSGAEEFVKKYSEENSKEQIIGHFGLGFYSAYMAADIVDIDTLSYLPNSESVFWSCDGSSEYTIDKGTRTERGTKIILHVNKESDEFLDAANLKQILTKYCSYLPYPIYLNEEHINPTEPLWLKSANECKDEDYLEFFRNLYPGEADPLFWIHLNVDYPFNLRGVLYFTHLDRSQEGIKNKIRLYCNRVYVSDNCHEILPSYLMAMRGAIDSPDIPLNVSRSSLQMDKTVRQLSTHISKKVADRINSLKNQDSETYYKSWEDISVIAKLGALQDEKFYAAIKDSIIWKLLDGTWTTLEDYISKNGDAYKKKIFYALQSRDSSHLESIYREKNIDVIVANDLIDQNIFAFFESKHNDFKFTRIDGALHEELLDASQSDNQLVDSSGRTTVSYLLDTVRSAFSPSTQLKFEAKALANSSISGFVVVEEQMRRMREYFARMNPEYIKNNPIAESAQTLVLNTNHPIVKAMPELSKKDPELAKTIVQHIYDLALIAQNEMLESRFSEFLKRDQELLTKMAEAIEGKYTPSAPKAELVESELIL